MASGISRLSARTAPYCLIIGVFLTWTLELRSADVPMPRANDFVLRDFQFQSGEKLSEVRMHYITFGTLRRDDKGTVRNAVMVLHGTTGSSAQFLGTNFAGRLFGAGQLLDAARYFIIIPDNLGHGKSSKPSDGLHMRFPKYGYRDMVEAQYRLLNEGLQVNHLRLVIGTSMGGMHTWIWGESHPDFMDALMPLACLPAEISGRNRVWRRMIIDSIRNDPGWNGGEYEQQPNGVKVAHEVLYFMGSNPRQRWKDAPTLVQADQQLDAYVGNAMKKLDANDVLYALEASRDYNPGPGLEKIRAPLVAVNFADDLINPPEIGLLEREIKRVAHGKAVIIAESERTRGHGTHTLAELWKRHLGSLLRRSEP
ncbi:MAG: homoserine O-acetyltransferase/O-succinyltransferase [Verrucomicrobiota bacterium]|jgi:homoserine O-acetyltransferase